MISSRGLKKRFNDDKQANWFNNIIYGFHFLSLKFLIVQLLVPCRFNSSSRSRQGFKLKDILEDNCAVKNFAMILSEASLHSTPSAPFIHFLSESEYCTHKIKTKRLKFVPIHVLSHSYVSYRYPSPHRLLGVLPHRYLNLRLHAVCEPLMPIAVVDIHLMPEPSKDGIA